MCYCLKPSKLCMGNDTVDRKEIGEEQGLGEWMGGCAQGWRVDGWAVGGQEFGDSVGGCTCGKPLKQTWRQQIEQCRPTLLKLIFKIVNK